MSAPPADPGVGVAPGDPSRLSAAADWHAQTATALEYHAGTLSGAAASLAGSWDGQAATAYQQLSVDVEAHFHIAAGTSRMAASALRRYSAELERCQREGKQALDQAIYWLTQARSGYAKLIAAQGRVVVCEAAVIGAEVEVAGSSASGPAGASARAAAEERLTAARRALDQAQQDERTAQRAFNHAEHQLTMWQHRGDRAWEEAEVAAVNATGSLEPLNVVPPPLAGMPAIGLRALSTVDVGGSPSPPDINPAQLENAFSNSSVPAAMKREWIQVLSDGDVIAAATENDPALTRRMMQLAYHVGSIDSIPTGVPPSWDCRFLGTVTVPNAFCIPHQFINDHAGTINFVSSAASLVPGLDVVAVPISLGTGAMVISKDVKHGDYVAAGLDTAGEVLGGASLGAQGAGHLLSGAKDAVWPSEHLQTWLDQDIARLGTTARHTGVAGFMAGGVYGQIWDHAHHPSK
jgi:hypothetical protein